jgi:hypothetical protein
MSEHAAAELETPTAGGQRYFSETELQALHSEDVHAGKAVVGLMVSIFSIGLVLYIGVCLFVW